MKFVERPRKQPDFPQFESQSGLMGLLTFFFSIVLWIGLIVIFLFTLYTNAFRNSIQSILFYFGQETYLVPFWVAGLCVFFAFPVTLVVVLLGYILKK
ncbi:hypothetical protein CSB37_03670 [bacterium DOLZORAL124_38_8]|nr:MAG: hypothetical protein CSB37_03670 [bacterium DOLZORAL124_38_8]